MKANLASSSVNSVDHYGQFANNFKPGDFLFGLYPRRHLQIVNGISRYNSAISKKPMREVSALEPYTVWKAHRFMTYSLDSHKPTEHLKMIESYFLDNDLATSKDESSSSSPNLETTRDMKKLSKQFIDFLIQSPYTLYFALDDVDMNQVVSKQKTCQGDDSKTGSELRKIFRLSTRPETQELAKERFIFLMNGQPVPPPWVSDPQLWSQLN